MQEVMLAIALLALGISLHRASVALDSVPLLLIAGLAFGISLGKFADASDRALGHLERRNAIKPNVMKVFLRFLLASVVEFRHVVGLGRAVRVMPRRGEQICPQCGHSVRPLQLLSRARACPVCGHYLPD
jgi:hypothetical protein